jgi:hypothetical protein
MKTLLSFPIVIATALAICPIALAQSYDQTAIPDAVDQGLYGPNTSKDEKVKNAMFGSNGETYQTHVNAPSNPVGIETVPTGAASLGTANADSGRCETAGNGTACH